MLDVLHFFWLLVTLILPFLLVPGDIQYLVISFLLPLRSGTRLGAFNLGLPEIFICKQAGYVFVLVVKSAS